jgi:hypothetical protein
VTVQTLHKPDLDAKMQFAGIKGTLRSILKGIDALKALEKKDDGRERSQLPVNGTFRRKFMLPAKFVSLLYGPNRRPAKLRGHPLVLKDNRLVAVDCSAESAEDAITWMGLVELKMERYARDHRLTQNVSHLLVARSEDEDVIALVTTTHVTAFSVKTAKRAYPPVELKDVGIRRCEGMTAGDDRIVCVDRSGRVVALDIRTGKKVWEVDGVSGESGFAQPLEVHHGVVFVRQGHKGGCRKRLTCFRLSDGRRMGRWRSSVFMQYLVSPSGMLVVTDDAEVSAYDIGQPYSPLWTRKVKSYPVLLGADLGRVAVSLNRDEGNIELLSLADGRVVGELNIGNIGNDKAVPNAVKFGQGWVCVEAGRGRSWAYTTTGWWPKTSGLLVARYNLLHGGTPELAWRKVLYWNSSDSMRLTTFELTREHVVISAHTEKTTGYSYVSLLNAQTGKVRQQIKAADEDTDNVAFQHVGGARISGKYLCIDMPDGLGVYHAQ